MSENEIEASKVITADGEEHSVGEAPQGGPQVLRVGIVGDNTIAQAVNVGFDTRGVERMMIADASELDKLVEWKPTLTFVCTDIPLQSNDTLDDADFLNIVSSVVKQVDSGVCIRSTLNIETIERMIMNMGPEMFAAKVVYMPVTGNESDVGEMLTADYQLVGGDEKAMVALMNLMKHTSHFSAQEVLTGTVFEVAYAKLGISGFKAVKQTFFNQLHDTILDVKNANPSIVRRLIEKSPELTDRKLMVPTYVRSRVDDSVTYKQARSFGGEYLNQDVRMLVGMTDKMPVLDECVNFKNLKG